MTGYNIKQTSKVNILLIQNIKRPKYFPEASGIFQSHCFSILNYSDY